MPGLGTPDRRASTRRTSTRRKGPSNRLELRPYVATGLPSIRGPVASVLLHVLAVMGLATIHGSAPPQPKPRQPEANDPTTIKIGDRSFFVTRLAPLVLPRPALAKTTPPPGAQPRRRASVQPAPSEKPAEQAAASQAPRVFIPPEVHRNLISESTLIQPVLPPDLVPVVGDLPSFRVQTAEMSVPKIPKPFVAPGRRKPQVETATPMLPPPDLEMVHAEPANSQVKAKLVLPPAPPPIVDTTPSATPTNAAPPAPVGEPLDVLSLSDRPVPAKDKIVVPPGNVVGRTGDGVVLRSGGSPPDSAGSGSAKKTEPNATAASKASDSSTSPSSLVSSNAASTAAPARTPGAGSSAAKSPGAEKTGNPGAAASGASSAAAPPAAAPARTGQVVVNRPPTGTFDAVVIQASPTDQFPESKGLLTGRPIYSVYVSANTSKDWTLFFCIPGGERETGRLSPNVVQLDSGAPVQAPYPTRIVRPGVSVPAFYKYVLVHGFVTAAGRFDRLHLVRGVQPETDDAILTALSGWEFRAATRDGQQIAVEFLLSIPVSGL